jgi:hypothetical protein
MDIANEYDENYIRALYPSHDVVTGSDGRLRWKAEPYINLLLDTGSIDLNRFAGECASRNIQKTDERYRKLYRDMGYSLFGYWEVFFWSMNND